MEKLESGVDFINRKLPTDNLELVKFVDPLKYLSTKGNTFMKSA